MFGPARKTLASDLLDWISVGQGREAILNASPQFQGTERGPTPSADRD